MLFKHPSSPPRSWRPFTALQLGVGLLVAAALAVAAIGPARLWAQIEGERGIAPVASTGDIEVDGIAVNTTGQTAEEARRNGWREATRQAWAKAGGPAMSDGELEGLVSSMVIQQEQIGPRRYIATLGVIFDRARASQFVSGGSPVGMRSQPLMVLPLLYSGGVAQIYEVRTPWQAAWARFHAGASAIDYVRPSGGGGDSLLLTAGQVSRRSRTWWRNILDQFGASDVIVPVARLERQWPGGPVKGTFIARYGPDNRPLSSFTLTAAGPEQLPAMLDEAVVRMDRIYTAALVAGTLRVDATLNADRLALDPAIEALLAAANNVSAAQESAAVAGADAADLPAIVAAPAADAPTSLVVQFASPDARAVDAAVAAVRGLAGVKSAATTSLAMGGTSVMRVSYTGSLEELAAGLRARGYTVTMGNGALSIRR